ncbi:hypothetical protein QAD02_009808, partial [Eretmocerus hayati]
MMETSDKSMRNGLLHCGDSNMYCNRSEMDSIWKVNNSMQSEHEFSSNFGTPPYQQQYAKNTMSFENTCENSVSPYNVRGEYQYQTWGPYANNVTYDHRNTSGNLHSSYNVMGGDQSQNWSPHVNNVTYDQKASGYSDPPYRATSEYQSQTWSPHVNNYMTYGQNAIGNSNSSYSRNEYQSQVQSQLGSEPWIPHGNNVMACEDAMMSTSVPSSCVENQSSVSYASNIHNQNILENAVSSVVGQDHHSQEWIPPVKNVTYHENTSENTVLPVVSNDHQSQNWVPSVGNLTYHENTSKNAFSPVASNDYQSPNWVPSMKNVMYHENTSVEGVPSCFENDYQSQPPLLNVDTNLTYSENMIEKTVPTCVENNYQNQPWVCKVSNMIDYEDVSKNSASQYYQKSENEPQTWVANVQEVRFPTLAQFHSKEETSVVNDLGLQNEVAKQCDSDPNFFSSLFSIITDERKDNNETISFNTLAPQPHVSKIQSGSLTRSPWQGCRLIESKPQNVTYCLNNNWTTGNTSTTPFYTKNSPSELEKQLTSRIDHRRPSGNSEESVIESTSPRDTPYQRVQSTGKEVRSYQKLSLKTQLDMISEIEGRKTSQKNIAQKYNVNVSRLQYILRRKDDIQRRFLEEERELASQMVLRSSAENHQESHERGKYEKCRDLSLNEKLNIIYQIEQMGRSKSAVAREYSLWPYKIESILNEKEQIKLAACQSSDFQTHYKAMEQPVSSRSLKENFPGDNMSCSSGEQSLKIDIPEEPTADREVNDEVSAKGYKFKRKWSRRPKSPPVNRTTKKYFPLKNLSLEDKFGIIYEVDEKDRLQLHVAREYNLWPCAVTRILDMKDEIKIKIVEKYKSLPSNETVRHWLRNLYNKCILFIGNIVQPKDDQQSDQQPGENEDVDQDEDPSTRINLDEEIIRLKSEFDESKRKLTLEEEFDIICDIETRGKSYSEVALDYKLSVPRISCIMLKKDVIKSSLMEKLNLQPDNNEKVLQWLGGCSQESIYAV